MNVEDGFASGMVLALSDVAPVTEQRGKESGGLCCFVVCHSNDA